MKPEDYLTSVQIDKLRAFNQDVLLKDAVYKVFLSPMYKHGVMEKGEEHKAPMNFVLTPIFDMFLKRREMWTDEQAGQWLKVQAQAIQLVEQGFGEIDKFQVEKPEERENEDESPQ